MAKRRYLLAIDQGTTGTHVLIVDDRLEVVGEAYREFTQYFPKAGWVEHDLREIWKTVERCCKKGLADADVRPDMVTAIGITNQRETTALWNRATGEPVGARDRLAGPAHGGHVRRAQGPRRGDAGPRDDRARARPVLQRDEAPLDAGPQRGAARPGRGGEGVLRDHRLLAGPPAHRRRAARHRRLEREPHPPLRPEGAWLERGDARAVRHPPRSSRGSAAAPRCTERRRGWTRSRTASPSPGWPETSRPRSSDRRASGPGSRSAPTARGASS